MKTYPQDIIPHIPLPADSESTTALRKQNEILLTALKHYANDNLYFPRGIVLECQKKGVRLAPIYSDFGEVAKKAIEESMKLTKTD